MIGVQSKVTYDRESKFYYLDGFSFGAETLQAPHLQYASPTGILNKIVTERPAIGELRAIHWSESGVASEIGQVICYYSDDRGQERIQLRIVASRSDRQVGSYAQLKIA
jgi:hypothetical protein